MLGVLSVFCMLKIKYCLYKETKWKNSFVPVENLSIYVIKCHTFPACNNFLLCELAREALHSILCRGSCSFAALTSERLLAAQPGPASYGFSHCRAFPLGNNHCGSVQLLPQDAQSLLSLCTAWEVFRSCLPSDISAVVSLL